jgi:hypothetical protein
MVDHGCTLHVFIPPDARVRTPKNTFKEALTKPSLQDLTTCAGPDVRVWCPLLLYLFIDIILAPRAVLSSWQGLVLLLPVILAAPPCSSSLQLLRIRLCSQMLDPPHCLQPLLWRLCSPHCLLALALASLAVVLADARPATSLALASDAVVLAVRCSLSRIACTASLCGCACRCLICRIACTCF